MKPNPAVSTMLFMLVSCNLVFIFTNLKPHHPSPDSPPGFEPITFLASRLSVMVATYLSTILYLGKHVTIDEVSATIQRTWRRPAATLVYIELFATAPASLLLMLANLARAVEGPLQEALLVSCLVGLLSYLGPTIFPYSDIVCKLGLVASVVEDGCEGAAALNKARELVEEVNLKGLVLTTVMTMGQQAPFMVFGCGRGADWCVKSLIFAGPAHLLMKFLAYFGYTLFYFECKRRSVRDGVK